MAAEIWLHRREHHCKTQIEHIVEVRAETRSVRKAGSTHASFHKEIATHTRISSNANMCRSPSISGNGTSIIANRKSNNSRRSQVKCFAMCSQLQQRKRLVINKTTVKQGSGAC